MKSVGCIPKNIIYVFLVVTVALLGGLYLRVLHRGRSEAIKNQPTAQELYAAVKPTVVYGRIVDADGAPLRDASVVLAVRTFDFLVGKPQNNHEALVESATDGTFVVKFDKPFKVFVKSVTRQGYIFEPSESSRYDLLTMHSSPENLINLRMRKLGKPTFLLSAPRADLDGQKLLDVSIGMSATNKLNVFQVESFRDYWPDKKDIEVVARYDKAAKDWEIIFRSLDPEAGIYLSPENLFIAPDSDYTDQVRLRTTNAPEHQRYCLFLRRKAPELFVKIEVLQTVWRPKNQPQRSLEIVVKSRTNPYGDRNFEPLEPSQENWLVFKEHTRYCLQCINEGRRADPKHLDDLLAKPINAP